MWDETRGLAGEVGRHMAEVRRNGKNWHPAAISDCNARQLRVPLKFLGPDSWKVTPWEDAPDRGQNAEPSPGDCALLEINGDSFRLKAGKQKRAAERVPQPPAEIALTCWDRLPLRSKNARPAASQGSAPTCF